MLNDQRLEQLLRDAHEVDAFEAGSRLAPAAGTTWRATWYASAAAVLVVGSLAFWAIQRSRPVIPSQIVQTPEAVHGAVLMAVAEEEGRLTCVRWRPESGSSISEATSDQLAQAGSVLACELSPTQARGRVWVVGIEGPTHMLPGNDARAREIAECLMKSPPCGSSGEVFDAQACASAGCVGSGVKMRVATIASR